MPDSTIDSAIHTSPIFLSDLTIQFQTSDANGGYRPGLAEDLETSLALHARGWKSAYVCEPLAPGMDKGSRLTHVKTGGWGQS
jgi:hypothetical protein